MLARLEPAAAALVDWAIDAALPLWATAGFDAEHGRFEERLTLAGGRLPDVPLRLMSQARQIHAYALAARRGWHADAAALVERAYASMVRDYRGRDDREGWIFSIRRDGTVADARRDLYTHAFVLLAIASYVEATGRREALALADETIEFIKRHMAAPVGGGFVEELPANGGARRQNPHMHLFEGLLSLWECSRQERHLARTTELFD
ncbi:MAG: AGE family epimerase/isomerase, partial [Reyranellaceae bacterium]